MRILVLRSTLVLIIACATCARSGLMGATTTPGLPGPGILKARGLLPFEMQFGGPVSEFTTTFSLDRGQRYHGLFRANTTTSETTCNTTCEDLVEYMKTKVFWLATHGGSTGDLIIEHFGTGPDGLAAWEVRRNKVWDLFGYSDISAGLANVQGFGQRYVIRVRPSFFTTRYYGGRSIVILDACYSGTAGANCYAKGAGCVASCPSGRPA